MSLDPQPLPLDGSTGEGGGQILRSALSLSLCLGRPFQIHRIRAARARPGLQPQHLMAVRAAAELGQAEVSGAEIGSQDVLFRPTRRPRGGHYRFAIGTAGSTTLLLQALLPPLLTAPEPSELVLEGGTHNPLAPTYEFLERTFLPLIHRMGPRVELTLERPGFYPAGGGRLRARVTPVSHLRPLYLPERGALRELRATALLCRLPDPIGPRELAVLARGLDIPADRLRVRRLDTGRSPGNALFLEAQGEAITELFSGIGRRGLPAEAVAQGVLDEARAYLQAGVPVGEHLADQLLLPLALAGAGAFVTLPPSPHTHTQLAVLRDFLPLAWSCQAWGPGRWRIACGPDAMT